MRGVRVRGESWWAQEGGGGSGGWASVERVGAGPGGGRPGLCRLQAVARTCTLGTCRGAYPHADGSHRCLTLRSNTQVFVSPDGHAVSENRP